MADKDIKDFMKRRMELAGLTSGADKSKLKGLSDSFKKTLGKFPLVTSVNKNSPLNKLGPSGKFSSALKDMPKDKPSRISDVAKKIFKRSPVGRVIDAGTKIGLGAAAGYEYAKSKFKDKEEKVDKKATGGMAEYYNDKK
jgi:hypothetical protein